MGLRPLKVPSPIFGRRGYAARHCTGTCRPRLEPRCSTAAMSSWAAAGPFWMSIAARTGADAIGIRSSLPEPIASGPLRELGDPFHQNGPFRSHRLLDEPLDTVEHRRWAFGRHSPWIPAISVAVTPICCEFDVRTPCTFHKLACDGASRVQRIAKRRRSNASAALVTYEGGGLRL